MFELARRCASSLEQSNDQSDAIIRIQREMLELSMKRYEYERLNADRFAERERAQRHHDVLCLVLRELVVDRRELKLSGEMLSDCLENARAVADLAYPPPKAEP